MKKLFLTLALVSSLSTQASFNSNISKAMNKQVFKQITLKEILLRASITPLVVLKLVLSENSAYELNDDLMRMEARKDFLESIYGLFFTFYK